MQNPANPHRAQHLILDTAVMLAAIFTLAALTLLVTGAYVPAMRPILGEESSLAVDLILTIREHLTR